MGEVSLEQQIVDVLHEATIDEYNNSEKNKWLEKVHNILWAIQISSWLESKYYYDRPQINNINVSTVSCMSCDQGMTYMRLNADFEFFSFIKTPPRGFAKYFKPTDELAKLFEMLSDKINLKILFYILSLKPGEIIRISTVAKQLNIPEKKAAEFLDYLCDINPSNGSFRRFSMLSGDNSSEAVYWVKHNTVQFVFILLAGADTMLKQPSNFQLQSGMTNKPWFNRDDFDFIANNKKGGKL